MLVLTALVDARGLTLVPDNLLTAALILGLHRRESFVSGMCAVYELAANGELDAQRRAAVSRQIAEVVSRAGGPRTIVRWDLSLN